MIFIHFLLFKSQWKKWIPFLTKKVKTIKFLVWNDFKNDLVTSIE